MLLSLEQHGLSRPTRNCSSSASVPHAIKDEITLMACRANAYTEGKWGSNEAPAGVKGLEETKKNHTNNNQVRSLSIKPGVV